MKQADWNRAMDKAESFTESMLLQIVGFPKPLTALTVIVVGLLALCGAYWLFSLL